VKTSGLLQGTHLLCISGFHVGLVLAALLFIAQRLRLSLKAALFIAIPVLLFYAVMTGLTPSVLRAAVMAVFFLAAHHLGRDRDWPTTLAAAALVILLVNPLTLFDAGFQLSFAATWGILYITPMLSRPLKFLPAFLRLPVDITLAAQLGVLPLVAYYYNLVSPVSLMVNLAAAPLVSLVVLLGAVAALAGLFYLPLAGLLAVAAGALLDLLVWLASLFQSLPGAVFNVPTPSVALIAGWYGIVFTTGRFITREEWRYWVRARLNMPPVKSALAALAGAVLVLAAASWLQPAEMQVHFIDVGQGDSAFIITPGGRTALIDAGGRYGEFIAGNGVGENVVVPYLRRLGVQKLDLLVLTHGHEDHAGGAAAVLENFPVKMVLVSPAGLSMGAVKETSTGPAGALEEPYFSLVQDIKKRGIPIRAVWAGDRIKLDPAVEIYILSPGPLFEGTGADANNNSLILRVVYNRTSFLFCGDAEKEAQDRLLKPAQMIAVFEADAYPASGLKSDVIKVPHHGGSNFSCEFISAVSPKVAVISVGARNRFGHPSAEILKVLREAGVKVYRTDLDGAVIIKSNGYALRIRTGRERAA